MKTGMTLQELASTVISHRSGKTDYVAPTEALRFGLTDSNAIRLQVGDGVDLGLRPNATAQVTDFLKIPRRFASMLQDRAPEVLLANLNGLMGKAEGRRMVRTLDGDARALLSPSYACIDDEIIFDGLYPRLMGLGAQIVSCNVSEDYLHLKAIFGHLEGEIRKGDIVRWGVSIRNSEIGKGAFSIDPWMERLVCTNGMRVTEHSRRRAHLGGSYLDGDGSWIAMSSETSDLKVRAIVSEMGDHLSALASRETFNRIVGELRDRADDPLPAEAPRVVESLSARYNLSKPESESCLMALAAGGDMSRWGLANAVTVLANTTQDYDRASDLETLGGKIMTLGERDYRALATMPRRSEVTEDVDA